MHALHIKITCAGRLRLVDLNKKGGLFAWFFLTVNVSNTNIIHISQCIIERRPRGPSPSCLPLFVSFEVPTLPTLPILLFSLYSLTLPPNCRELKEEIPPQAQTTKVELRLTNNWARMSAPKQDALRRAFKVSGSEPNVTLTNLPIPDKGHLHWHRNFT